MKIAAVGILAVVGVLCGAAYVTPPTPAQMALRRVQQPAPRIADYDESMATRATHVITYAWTVAGTGTTCIITTNGETVLTSGYATK